MNKPPPLEPETERRSHPPHGLRYGPLIHGVAADLIVGDTHGLLFVLMRSVILN